ncbi:MAG: sulfotransferase [Geminicoccaceae bacterium]
MSGPTNGLDRPIIILGAPCSGTTFLGHTLGRHASLAFADEPRLVWRYGNDHKSDMLYPEDAGDRVIDHIRSYFSGFVHDRGGQRLLEKTPSNSLRPEFVERILPGCRFLHITRHPLDAVLSIRSKWLGRAYGIKTIHPGRVGKRRREISLQRLPYYSRELICRTAPAPIARLFGPNIWGPRLPGIRSLLRDMDLLDVCALQWRTCVDTAVHFGRRLPSDRYLELRLEVISVNVMSQIIEFCELEKDAEVLRVFKEGHKPSLAGGRKTSASTSDMDRILRWTEPTMTGLGYSY